MLTRLALSGIFALAFLNVLAWGHIIGRDALAVTFFAVGQGDAIFIETERGHQILIDGGPDKTIEEKLGQSMPFWDRSIDLVILTHADSDHISGLVSVLEKFDLDYIMWSGITNDTNIFEAWEKEAAQRQEDGTEVIIASANQRILLGSSTSYIDILHPANRRDGKAWGEMNDTSVVAKLVHGNDSFLLPGDISEAVEKEFVARGTDIRADVLKVPHHGSKSSSSMEFLEAVAPGISVISVGEDNRYGHPHPDVVMRLQSLGIPVLRTDQDHDILFKSRGNLF